jgi:putative endonuclease
MATRTKRQNIGKLGEDIAVRFLVKHGYSVVERNYLRKWGELDIICRKDGVFHFIEVKAVSRETVLSELNDDYRPEDNVHTKKLGRIRNTIQTYIIDRAIEGDWMFHVISVTLDPITKVARVRIIENIVL